MATLTIPYSFVNGTTAVAAEVNGNFSAIKTFCEALAAGTNIDAGAITSGFFVHDWCCCWVLYDSEHYG
jgi:hypothetical protein